MDRKVSGRAGDQRQVRGIYQVMGYVILTCKCRFQWLIRLSDVGGFRVNGRTDMV